MRILPLLVLCVIHCVPVARAQSLIGECYDLIGPADFYDSSGVPLDDFGAILQQDRANFHRFSR
jgi:hypothetical protein